MKRLGTVLVLAGVTTSLCVAGTMAHAGAAPPAGPYHQESSIRVVHTATGYRVVAPAALSTHIGARVAHPYHQESSIRVVRTAHGYRIVSSQ